MELSPVILPATAGKIWWQVPGAVWQQIPGMRNRRLFKAIDDFLLPQLVQIEALYAAKNDHYKSVLKGKSMAQILGDLNAVEIGINLFDIAVAQKLVVLTKPGKGRKAFGSCAMTVSQGKNAVIRAAAEIALIAQKHDAKNLDLFFGTGELTDPTILSKLLMLLGFDPLTTRELKAGLGARFAGLAAKDVGYLQKMQACQPLSVLRPLRLALKKDFVRILDWDGDYFGAIAEHLNHQAKISALGRDLLVFGDPEKIRAIGEWEIAELPQKPGEKKKKYRTRIGEVKKLLGLGFHDVMAAPPDVVRTIGGWTNDEIERVKHFLGLVSGDVLQILSELPFDQQAGILDGLWEKFGKSFLETDLNEPVGLQAIRDVIVEIRKMARRGNNPTDLKTMILNDFFHAQLQAFTRPK